MARPIIQVTTLHGYTIKELVNLKNTTDSKYTRRVLLEVVILRYKGYSNAQLLKLPD